MLQSGDRADKMSHAVSVWCQYTHRALSQTQSPHSAKQQLQLASWLQTQLLSQVQVQVLQQVLAWNLGRLQLRTIAKGCPVQASCALASHLPHHADVSSRNDSTENTQGGSV